MRPVANDVKQAKSRTPLLIVILSALSAQSSYAACVVTMPCERSPLRKCDLLFRRPLMHAACLDPIQTNGWMENANHQAGADVLTHGGFEGRRALANIVRETRRLRNMRDGARDRREFGRQMPIDAAAPERLHENQTRNGTGAKNLGIHPTGQHALARREFLRLCRTVQRKRSKS